MTLAPARSPRRRAALLARSPRRLAALLALAAGLAPAAVAAQDGFLDYELRPPGSRDFLSEQRLRRDPANRDRLLGLEMRHQAEELRRLRQGAAPVAPGGRGGGLPGLPAPGLPAPGLPLPTGLTGVIRASGAGEGGRVGTIRELFRALRACWRLPAAGEGPAGAEMTVRLAFKRSGAVMGEPRITYHKAAGGREDQERFRRSVTESLRRCTPMPFANDFGGAIAGRPVTVRYVDDRST